MKLMPGYLPRIASGALTSLCHEQIRRTVLALPCYWLDIMRLACGLGQMHVSSGIDSSWIS